MFEPKQLAWAFITWAIVLVAGNQAARSSERITGYYPHCSPIAHEIDRAWHEGQISERTAHTLIQRCLAAEERGAFD